ncbi:methylaspartate mutase [Micromonospora phytophila]|nr:methylaspartate mutase [Micromonospora phytophila]
MVQPRMGFGRPEEMREGLRAVAGLGVSAVGTITLDSHTRVGDHTTPLDRLAQGEHLNGYPIVSHPVEVTRELLRDLHGPAFPVQVRHGTAQPQQVFRRLIEVGLDTTEGGPVSYCLPYSRLPLTTAVRAWTESCRYLAGETEEPHIESFGGCLLGQLCPPSLLVAVTLLEGMFFRQHGVRNVSLSYAQGTLGAQDRGALRALRELARRYLGDDGWHVVLYTYMGVFPQTTHGASALIADSARLARQAGCERLIVKTVSESRQIPTVQENLDAVRLAVAAAAETGSATPDGESFQEEVRQEAASLVDHVLALHDDIGRAMVKAFAAGVLDIPYCLHPDNHGRARCVIDDRGALVWASRGNMPLSGSTQPGRAGRVTARELRWMLHHVADSYDRTDGADRPPLPPTTGESHEIIG